MLCFNGVWFESSHQSSRADAKSWSKTMVPYISILNAEVRLLSLEPTEIYHSAT